MGLVRFKIYCLECERERYAEHVHGSEPWRGKVHRARRLGCWNQCCTCGALYESLRCGARERAHQKQLEREGQETFGF